MIPSQIAKLKQALANPLPGWEMQKRMAPANRRTDIDRAHLMTDDYRESSTLLLLYPQNDALHFILIRRPEYEGVHSGQIAFPGGRREGEESYLATALREANEEIGVLPEQVTMLGTLTPLYIPPSRVLVYTHVGFCSSRPNCHPNEREVAEILEPPLSLLLDPSTRKWEEREFTALGPANVPYYDIYGHKVWGATAMMLAEFSSIIEPIHVGV
ncbi:MAG: CoA pyrophosphatase [Chloroflexota bacterium]